MVVEVVLVVMVGMLGGGGVFEGTCGGMLGGVCGCNGSGKHVLSCGSVPSAQTTVHSRRIGRSLELKNSFAFTMVADSKGKPPVKTLSIFLGWRVGGRACV